MVCHDQRRSGNTSLSIAIKAISRSMTLSPRQVNLGNAHYCFESS